jgi:hypothetical protein
VMMKICATCGNEINASEMSCGYCGSLQKQSGVQAPGVRRLLCYTVNMEAGRPSVEEGVQRLKEGLLRARHSGAKVIRVIHGYGSSGTGGKLREACRLFLRQEKACRQIRSFLPGEDYSRESVAGKELFSRYPGLRQSERSDSRNPGITLVEL